MKQCQTFLKSLVQWLPPPLNSPTKEGTWGQRDQFCFWHSSYNFPQKSPKWPDPGKGGAGAAMIIAAICGSGGGGGGTSHGKAFNGGVGEVIGLITGFYLGF